MKQLYWMYPLFLLAAWLHADAALTSVSRPLSEARTQTAHTPLFVENRGQWDRRALFCLPSSDMTVWGTANGLVYDYRKMDSDGEHIEGHVVRMEFSNALPPVVSMQEQAETQYNYFRGGDSSQWVAGVRGFREVLYSALYKGVGNACRSSASPKPASPMRAALIISRGRSIVTQAPAFRSSPGSGVGH